MRSGHKRGRSEAVTARFTLLREHQGINLALPADHRAGSGDDYSPNIEFWLHLLPSNLRFRRTGFMFIKGNSHFYLRPVKCTLNSIYMKKVPMTRNSIFANISECFSFFTLFSVTQLGNVPLYILKFCYLIESVKMNKK